MGGKVLFLEFPESIPLAKEAGNHRYLKSDSMYAVFGESRDSDKILFSFEKPKAVVCSGVPNDSPDPSTESSLAPVYQVDGQGPPSIPTGEILVRVASDRKITEIQSKLEELGYTLKNVLSYAPHACLVQATSGKIEDALSGLKNLFGMPGVEHVEPQMLSQPAKKSS